MSTDLSSGLRLKDPTQDLFEVFAILHGEIQKAKKQAMINLVSESIASYIEGRYQTNEDDFAGSLLLAAEEEWHKQQTAYGSRHALNDPLRFSMVFGKSNKGNILAYPYHIENLYNEAIKATGLFEDYGYWDMTDGPADLTIKEFKERGREWESIENKESTFSHLPLYKTPTNNPFNEFLWLTDEEKDALPLLDEYITPKKRFYDSLQSQIFKILKSENKVDENIFDTFWKVRDTVYKYAEEVGFNEDLYPDPFNKNMFINIEDLPEVKDYSALCQTLISYGEL